MIRHLEIKHLRMVSTLAAMGNMTKAAERLHVSQSALSQQLKDIEGKLQVDLFYRTRKRMSLTPIGKKLLATAEQVLARIDQTELEIAKIVSGDRGELKVGTQCIFCYKWLPRVMRLFQHKFPNVEFEIGNSTEPTADLHNKKYDIVITAAAEKEQDLTCFGLFEDQMVAILPLHHPLSARPFLRYEDFQNARLISHAERKRNRFYQLSLKPRGVMPRRLMAVGQPQAIVEMVAAGFGVSVFPRWAVAGALAQKKITALPITPKGLPVIWQAVLLKKSHLPEYQKEFMHILAALKPAELEAPGAIACTANTIAIHQS